MLPLPPFSLLRPRQLSEALGMLAEEPGARAIAGGTDMLPSMKYGIYAPTTLVSLGGLAELRVAESRQGGLWLGAGLSLAEVRRNARVHELYPALSDACATVATPTLQAMGTLGGNVLLDTRCLYYNQSSFWRESLGGCLKCEVKGPTICHVAPKGKGCYAAHSADTVPALTLYGARAELASSRGTREVPLSELYGEDGRTYLHKAPDELLTGLWLPPPDGVVVHRKLRRRGAIDYPLLLVAAKLDPEGRGRVVLSAIGPRPLEVQGLAETLASDGVDAAAELAWKQAFPLATHSVPSVWRKRMVRVEVRRALEQARALLAPPSP